jgi:hypothetical protein
MSVLDDVICLSDLFGIDKGKTCQTDSLDAVFPGSTYEITSSGDWNCWSAPTRITVIQTLRAGPHCLGQ